MRRTRVLAALLCAGMFAAPVVAHAAPTSEATVSAARLTTVTKIASMSRAEVAAYLTGYELDAAAARHGVDLYRINYRTAGTTASALVALPRSDARRLPTVAWLHGTRAYRGYTGSMDNNLDRAAAVQFAAAGYATSAPDYLGLGEGPGHHPYMVERPTVTASIDALHATRELAARHGVRLNRDVAVTGFSQGGNAAMQIGRALQEGAGGYFRTNGIASLSGPLDIRGAELPAVFDGRLDGRSAAFYLGYVMVAWHRQYGLWDSPSEAFLAPYDQMIETLFDGEHREEDIFAALPATPEELFTPEYVAKIKNQTGELRRILAANDRACRDWRPRVPVRLFTSTGDRDASTDNTWNCAAQLSESGAHAQVVNLGDLDHFAAGRRAVPLTLEWLKRLD
jgi:hypothetical protein